MSMGSDAISSLLPPQQQAAPEPEAAEEHDDARVVWEPDMAVEDFEIRLQDGSIRPMSEASLRSMVIELKKVGMIDTAHALQMLDVPDWEEIAASVQKELELAAIAKTTRTR